MQSFLFSFQFLTILPVRLKRPPVSQEISASVVYFPVVGLVLGFILAGLNEILILSNSAPLLCNAILVVSLIILTGGLHMDGLADTWDAIGSFKDRENCLKIMRDSHIGVMGVLALISVILLKLSLLLSIPPDGKRSALLLMCVISRWSMVIPVWLFPYAREEGKGKGFFENMNLKKFTIATSIALLSAVMIFGGKGIAVILIAALFAYLFSRYINQKIGGITGDILGAVNEMVEWVVLLSVYVIGRF